MERAKRFSPSIVSQPRRVRGGRQLCYLYFNNPFSYAILAPHHSPPWNARPRVFILHLASSPPVSHPIAQPKHAGVSSVRSLSRRSLLKRSPLSTSAFASDLVFLARRRSLRKQATGFGDVAQEIALASKLRALGWQVGNSRGCSRQQQSCHRWQFRRQQPVEQSQEENSRLKRVVDRTKGRSFSSVWRSQLPAEERKYRTPECLLTMRYWPMRENTRVARLT